MGSLNAQGIISAVTAAIYLPVLFFAFRVSYRYGIKQRAWLLLVVFSSIRIIGGVLLVAAELVVTVSGLYIGGYALEASGLSPLLLSTLGLLEIITEGPDKEKKHARVYRILHLTGLVALILVIIGMTSTSTNSGSTERRVGVILFVGLYIVLVGLTVMQWVNRYRLMKYRKQLLLAVSVALPFLAVRTVYSLLSTFSSSTFSSTTTDSSNPLAKFNIFTGEWQLYVVMEIVMEYAVVLIYAFAGTVLQLDQDYKLQTTDTDEYPLYAPQYPPEYAS